METVVTVIAHNRLRVDDSRLHVDAGCRHLLSRSAVTAGHLHVRQSFMPTAIVVTAVGKCSESVQSRTELYVLKACDALHAQTWASYSAVY